MKGSCGLLQGLERKLKGGWSQGKRARRGHRHAPKRQEIQGICKSPNPPRIPGNLGTLEQRANQCEGPERPVESAVKLIRERLPIQIPLPPSHHYSLPQSLQGRGFWAVWRADSNHSGAKVRVQSPPLTNEGSRRNKLSTPRS